MTCMTCVGIDVGKDHLDVAVRFSDSEEVQTSRVENTAEGQRLLPNVSSISIHSGSSSKPPAATSAPSLRLSPPPVACRWLW